MKNRQTFQIWSRLRSACVVLCLALMLPVLPALAQTAETGGDAAATADAATASATTTDAGGMVQEAERVVGNVFEWFEPVTETGVAGLFAFLGAQAWVFILVSLAIGYPLGRVKFGPISLGSTAGSLLVAVLISMAAAAWFDITYSIPGIVSTIFLSLFMYALGLGVGPKFFSGLKAAGMATVIIGLIIWSTNWLICMIGAKLADLDSGYAAGLIAGSYTITAIMGVAQSAVQSGTAPIPEGMSAEQIGANMAAGYAISYILSSIFTILLMRYIPKMFGHDPVADAKVAEKAFAGSGTHGLPGTPQAFLLGYSPLDVRAYKAEHDTVVGKSISQLFEAHPQAPVLRVVRDGAVVPINTNPTIQMGDVIAIRSDVSKELLHGGAIGAEVDDPLARGIEVTAGDIHVGSRDVSGKTLEELAKSKLAYGVRLEAMFRAGQEIPVGPTTDVRFGDVLRVTGPKVCLDRAAKALGGHTITPGTLATTEVQYLAIAMAIGYIFGTLSVTVGGIPFALGTSAGCLLAGIFVAYFRSRNPEFGGPVSEGARSFLQDIGLNVFVCVLGANTGAKIITALSGDTVIWLAVIGLAGALLPVVIAYFVGDKILKMNSVINAGACSGGRNSTPSLNAALDESKSAIAAVPYPVAYALTTVLALIGGYIAQILS